MLALTEFLSNWIEVLKSPDGQRGLLWWSVVCLIFYFYHRYRVLRLKTQRQQLSARLTEAEQQKEELEAERNVTRDENRLLRIFLAQPTFRKAVDVALRQYVREPRESLAAVVQVLGDEQTVLFSRGLSSESKTSLRLPGSLLARLTANPWLYLQGHALQESDLLYSLAKRDRSKVGQLAVAAAGNGEALSLVVFTSELLPQHGTFDEQRELLCRMTRLLDQRLRQERDMEIQRNQLRLTSNMLHLRSSAEGSDEPPTVQIRKYLAELTHLLHADRITVFLTGGENPSQRQVIRGGDELPIGAALRWQEHEETILQNYRTREKSVALSSRQLQQLGVTSLIGAALVVPMIREGRLVAHLCCTRRESAPFAGAEEDLAEWAAGDLTNVMYRLLNHFSVVRQARTDALTQLANRREFDGHIIRLCKRAISYELPASFLLLDVDHFKQINDTYGHLAGDAVLQQIADRLRQEVPRLARGEDKFLIARYGGEELAVLLHDVPEAGAARVAEALRRAVEEAPFSFEEDIIPVTVSIGVSTCPQHAKTVEEFIASADAALYAAKQGGRNCVVTATQAARQKEAGPV